MTNRLEPIIKQKQLEVAALQASINSEPDQRIAKLLRGETARTAGKRFKNALRAPDLAIIAEIKRQSPSKGRLAEIDDPVALAMTYVKGGANALSVLTDENFFAGHLEDLASVSKALTQFPQPILRKDFIIDAIQIAQAIAAGADAILCIVAVLGERTKNILQSAKAMGIEVLVEIHDARELEIAVASGADIIGVNNRNLSTFEVDTEQALRLLEHIPKEIVKVAESGILVPELAQTYYRAGFDAVLVGEALVRSPSPADFMRACRHA